MTITLSLLAAGLTVGSFAPRSLTPFRPSEVRVGGEIGQRMDVTVRKMLHQTDIDGTFARHFRERKPKPEMPGGFAGYGMFLDALVKAAAHGIGGRETVAVKTRLLDAVADMVTTNGLFTMYSDKVGFWDNHEGAYLIQALALDHRWFGSACSLATACRVADGLIARGAYPTLGSETAYILLYEETGNKKYLKWLESDAAIADDIDAYDRAVKVNGVQHVYTWLARALAQIQYADLRDLRDAARAPFCAAAQEVFRRTRSPYMSVSGSLTGTPRWGELWDQTQAGLGQWGETCASAYLMRLAAKTMERDCQTFYGDLFERVLYNAFFSAQSADGLKYRYWTPFNELPPWYDRDTYCCPNNYKREMFEVPDAVFFKATDGLAVNLYSDAVLTVKTIAAKMQTRYPSDGTVHLDVTMSGGGRALYLRIPAWCTDARVTVAGETAEKLSPGWIRLERDFSKGLAVDLDLPMPVRLVRGVRAQEGRLAVMRGPCVYGLALGSDTKAAHDVDLWDLDVTAPIAWDAKPCCLQATFKRRSQDRNVRPLPLVRYCNERRSRTYFDPLGRAPADDDELTTPARARPAQRVFMPGQYPNFGRADVGDFAEIGPKEYRPLRRELRAFYPRECHEMPQDKKVLDSFSRSWREAQAWSAAHTNHTALQMRRAGYAIERKNFVPVLFDELPFYFETGINGGYCRGNRELTPPGRCTRLLCNRFYRERNLVPPEAFKRASARSRYKFAVACGTFVDEVHDLPPFHAVFTKGFGGIRADVEKALAACPADDAKGRAELEAMRDGLDTIRVLQLRFADEAERRLAALRDKSGPAARNYRRIAESARRCPWEPPRTFFEGLNTLWFTRELMAYVDGLCCHALGRPDAWLIDFYRRDLAEGRLTADEARDLVSRFMIAADCHLDGYAVIDGGADQEGEMQLTLGGCDADGKPVWNELTRLFIEEHRRLELVFPKLHVRYGADSPQEYLEAIAAQVLDNHPVFAMFNDDIHIPGFVARGVPLDRARDYEGTGCWDGLVDTASDCSVGNYTSAISTLIAALYRDFKSGEECGFRLEALDGAKTIDEFRTIAYGNYWRMLARMLDDYTKYGPAYAEVSPCPLYSACLDGCVERRRDCRDGGMKWAPRCINIGLLANVVDSICAIDKVVYRDRFCTLGEFLAVMRDNWRGERGARIRAEVLKSPYWGDNSAASNREMRFWLESLARDMKGLKTDQGGDYEIACWIYREFLFWGEQSPATPDGRFRGDRFAQGFAPSEYRCQSGVSDVFNAIASLDHTKLFASNANLMFGGEDLTPELLAACFRVYAQGKGHLLQPNCCDLAALVDAQRHPERHLDLMVKVCGFTARFITLSKRFQDEVITRHRLTKK